jgi:hypothetical protein
MSELPSTASVALKLGQRLLTRSVAFVYPNLHLLGSEFIFLLLVYVLPDEDLHHT